MVAAGGQQGAGGGPSAAPDGPSRCSACRGRDLTRLPMVLTDGSDVLFVSCQACERREWFEPAAEGWAPLPIDSVLQRSTKPR